QRASPSTRTSSWWKRRPKGGRSSSRRPSTRSSTSSATTATTPGGLPTRSARSASSPSSHPSPPPSNRTSAGRTRDRRAFVHRSYSGTGFVLRRTPILLFDAPTCGAREKGPAMRKKTAATFVALSMLGGGAAGIALVAPTAVGAQTSSATASAAPQSPPGWMTDALSKLVSDGTITQAQADAVSSALQAARPPGGPHGGPGL